MNRQHVENAIASLKLALDSEAESPPWMDTARGELGVRELPGAAHSDRVLEYLDVCRKDVGGNLGNWGAGRDETPWCSAFVNWCLLRSGIEGTRNAAARSWLKWGRHETVMQPGCIVVLSRDGGGHVGFYVASDGERVTLLGGNQGDRVSVASYPLDRVVGVRWPL